MKEVKQFVIVAAFPGGDAFIMKSELRTFTAEVSDRIADAEVFTYGQDNPVTKCMFFNGITGLDLFEARPI